MSPPAWLLLVLLSACSSSQVVGGNCHYEKFHGTCRFVALDHGGTGQAITYYTFDGARQLTAVEEQLSVEFSIADDRLAAFEAHLRAHPALPCGGELAVSGSCVAMLGHVDIPSFDGATPIR